jgi:hypothetical protein
MSKQIVMKNPDLNPIVMDLETPIWTLRQIWAEDRKAGKTDYNPTDSTVTSAARWATSRTVHPNRSPKKRKKTSGSTTSP